MRNAILCFLVLGALPVMAQKKHAMLFAVSHYAKETGWKDINSKNDIPLITQALKSRGFDEKDIHAYVDKPMDNKAILAEMERVLVQGTQPGDIVYFHFSGHGQQIADDDGDEEDGLDEALVPYNAPVRNTYEDARKTPYDYSRHLRDDDLRDVFAKVRKHLGPKGNLFVTLDACHSGSATRGFGPARGTDEKNVPKDWKERKPSSSNARGVTGEEDTSYGLTAGDKSQLAPMVCFFGSRSNQKNFEYKEDESLFYGSLSYALVHSLNTIGADASYRALYDQVRIKMSSIAPMQQPSYDGELDQLLLNGKLLGAVQYANPTKIFPENIVMVNKGKLSNYHEGCIIGFFPPDSRDWTQARPLAVGKIISTTFGESYVQLDTMVLDSLIMSSWAIITEQSFSAFKCDVFFEGLDDRLKSGIMENLDRKGMKFVSLARTSVGADILITNDRGRYNLVSSQGLDLATYAFDQIDSVTERIREFTQVKYLKSLHTPNSRYHAAIDVIFHKVDPGTKDLPPQLRKYVKDEARPHLSSNATSSSIALEVGDLVSLRIRNLTASRSYFTLISLTPDHLISADNILIPRPNFQADEYLLNPLDSIELDLVFGITPPEGEDNWLLIVSKEPIDMRPTFRARGEGASRGTRGPLSNLFAQSFVAARGSEAISTPTEHIGIYRIPVQISQPQAISMKN